MFQVHQVLKVSPHNPHLLLPLMRELMKICKFLLFSSLLMLMSFNMIQPTSQNETVAARNISHLDYISSCDAVNMLQHTQVMTNIWSEIFVQADYYEMTEQSPPLVRSTELFLEPIDRGNLTALEGTAIYTRLSSTADFARECAWCQNPKPTSCELSRPIDTRGTRRRRFRRGRPNPGGVLSSRKKLKVGVIVRKGFKEFSKIKINTKTNDVEATGFCVDVFKQVMKSMPYVVPYTFSPFQTHEESVEDYITLVDQMFGDKKYDVLVGDVTITSKRSEYIDFTFPYTESGIAAIVPIKVSERTNRWIFLKPLTTSLWLTIGAFFVYTGIVVWVLEHRVNKEFQGPPLQQIGIIFWFSFSTLVFAQWEKVISNLTRFVVIVWMFVVLVLASSYTANLASMLTSRELQPTVSDIHDLIKSGEYIGYQDGSFVGEFLKNMKFKGSKFRHYTSFEEYNEALSKGSKNGGVAAIVDELPYIRLFLSKYCHKYTMIGPTYPTPGFGFIFPKGSPLVADVSRAILKVKEGEEIVRISTKWFKRECLPASDEDGTLTISESLNVDSFKGLFLIAGLSSASALAIFLSIFLYENRRMLTSTASLKQKLYLLSRAFYLVEDDITSSNESTNGGEGRVTTESLAICVASDQQGTCSQNEGSSTPDHAAHAHHIP